jgi:tRNA C32,U32 (ribose-2'-O)-methylase TrmJ
MSEEKPERPEVDPLGPMMQFYDAWAKSWSSTMSETVASERFAETMAQQMESGLDAMAFIRRQVGETMEEYLHQMSMPTRDEVISLAERLTKIEMTIDDIDAKMDEVLDQLKALQDN